MPDHHQSRAAARVRGLHVRHLRGGSRAGLLLLACLLFGCRLVDQRSFDASAGRAPVPPALPPGPAAAVTPPLLTIRFENGVEPSYRDALATVVDAARRRKPDVLFQVETVVPATGTPAQQVADAQGGSALGRSVAQSIVADGADVGQVALSARADPAVTAREVRVYVH